VLDHPFSGDLSVSAEPFKQGALAEYRVDEEPHVVAGGETVDDLTPGRLVGVWSSDAFGVVVLREVGDEVLGVYREGQGTVVGQVGGDGVFRG